MKYDTIIIGGGLAGLICGLRLQKAGQKCAIVSSGQSALHFSSGSFDLLGRLTDGTVVEKPADALDSLGKDHPYSIIGKEKVISYAAEVPEMFKSLGIDATGDPAVNTWRITPTGERKPSWLTLGDFTPMASKDEKVGNKVLIVNILGYMDFNTKFLADSFEKQGTVCRIHSIKLEEMERLRKNPSEMRASNIARVMDREEVWKKFLNEVKALIKDEDTVVLPAVFGLKNHEVPGQIREAMGAKTVFVATMPPSVPGIRTQMKLKAEFEKAGGRFLLGDTVKDAVVDSDGRVDSIGTANFDDIRMHADNFVLATGSFFSKGMVATPGKVFEPIFGIDLTYDEKREDWFDVNFWNKQNYISYGAKVNSRLNPSIDGKTISNLYVAGSILGGCNALYEGCGGGTAIISAMAAADAILEK